MLRKLHELEQQGRRIRVGVIGCGAMGIGVAWQVARTPGMEVVFLGDINEEVLARAAKQTGMTQVCVTDAAHPPGRRAGEVLTTVDSLTLLEHVEIDALVECTNVIYEAAQYCLAAIAQKAHVILMNAEVDLVFGTLLAHEARKQGVVVTSDAGDQHGVLATMADEIQLWGFKIVQAGNMKGFLDRWATSVTKADIAKQLRLSIQQCVSYTDGTKMNVEQALIGNYLGLTPFIPGMEGPRCADLREVMDKFDFAKYGDQGRVDYTLSVPWPGGGVYIVGHCDDDQQHFLLNYYKVTSKRPWYLFFRPYHLCHVETPRAIAQAYFDARPVIPPPLGKKTNNVYTYAKQDLPAGQVIHHAIGGDEVYGLVDATANAEPHNAVPICLLEPVGGQRAITNRALKKDERLSLADLDIPATPYHAMLERQAKLASGM